MEVSIGCWHEAERADLVASQLARLKGTLGLEFYDHISAVLLEVETTIRLLRDLYDLVPIYRSRFASVTYYLDIILPSVQRTLKDMMVYVDNPGLSSRSQWTLLIERMNDVANLTLASRFVRYNDFLVQLIRLLSRSSMHDPNFLETLRVKIVRLRLLQGINAIPLPITYSQYAYGQFNQAEVERRHWAEKVFEKQPRLTSRLRNRRTSTCCGPFIPYEQLTIPDGSSVLFKVPFDRNRLSITTYSHAQTPNVIMLLCRWTDKHRHPLYSCYGAHELCIERRGSSLLLKRWSSNHPVVWLAISFKTWENMVLFHACFVALKARSQLTITVNPNDYRLAHEKKLFQNKIVDDDFHHNLAVYQDGKSHGTRILASVGGGELARVPIWTAFVSHQYDDPDWLSRRTDHRIWLKDLKLYVFCNEYKKKTQLKKGKYFELYFLDKKAADSFEHVFRSVSISVGRA